MLVKILDISEEKIQKGKNSYTKAQVAYTYNGEARTQTLMSFANPDVFRKVKDFLGKEADVTITKNAAGYNEWAAIKEAGEASPTPTAGAPTRVTGSNYETPAERAQRQVYIIKQSSIGHAIEYLTAVNKGKEFKYNEVLFVADVFLNYVLGTGEQPVPTNSTE